MKRSLLVALILGAALVSRGSPLAESPFCVGALHAQQVNPTGIHIEVSAQQDPPMPPEGNPDHKEPPPGAYCDRSKRAAHECACHAKCVEDEEGRVTIQEDSKCRAWCFKKACRCPAEGCQEPTR